MKKFGLSKLILILVFYFPVGQAQETDQQIIARVGEVSIPVSDYIKTLRQAARSTFYHGKPPEEEFAALRLKVVEQMVDRILLVNEATSLGKNYNQQRVESRLDRLIGQHGQSESLTDEVKQGLRETLREEDIIDQMRLSVEANTVVSDSIVEQFYNDNPDLFTVPEQSGISMILLKVDPSSPQVAWEAALKESSKLVDMLKGGADFSELARIHSADASAENGGDMGYLHKGMLATEIQTVLDSMSEGDFSEPVLVLEGIAVFRLNDRKDQRLLPLDEVRDRATKLAQQSQVAENWKSLIERLRRQTEVEVNEALLSEFSLS